MMRRRFGILVAMVCAFAAERAAAQEIVHFPSFDDQHALVVQMVTAYLDAELRGDPALLTAVEGSSNPLVVVQQ